MKTRPKLNSIFSAIVAFFVLSVALPLHAQIVVMSGSTLETASANGSDDNGGGGQSPNTQEETTDATPSDVIASASFSSDTSSATGSATFTSTLTPLQLTAHSSDEGVASVVENVPPANGYIGTSYGQSEYTLYFSVLTTTTFTLDLNLSANSQFRFETSSDVNGADYYLGTSSGIDNGDHAGTLYSGNTYELWFADIAETTAENDELDPGPDSSSESATSQFDLSLAPEPSTFAMMVAGLALLGFCAHHRVA